MREMKTNNVSIKINCQIMESDDVCNRSKLYLMHKKYKRISPEDYLKSLRLNFLNFVNVCIIVNPCGAFF